MHAILTTERVVACDSHAHQVKGESPREGLLEGRGRLHVHGARVVDGPGQPLLLEVAPHRHRLSEHHVNPAVTLVQHVQCFQQSLWKNTSLLTM